MDVAKVVLLVDDEELIRQLAARILALNGFVVKQAANGQEALELARTLKPDVVITDGIMPIMSGIELCKQLRRDEATRNTPIIYVSGTLTPAVIASLKPLEISAIMDKPCTMNDLQAAITKALAGN